MNDSTKRNAADVIASSRELSGVAADDASLPPSIVVAPPGPRSRAFADRLSRVENPAFDARRESRADASGEDHAPIVYAETRGSNVVDVDGNRYVDLVMGFGACIFGHAPAFVQGAMNREAAKNWLALGDVYASEAKIIACEKLAALFPEKNARVILGLSGADAVTAALKTAVLKTNKPGVVAFEGSYHGLSYAPLAACGLAPGFRAPFKAQLGDHVGFAPYPFDENSLHTSISIVESILREKNAGAVLVEPILGRGGCVVPPKGFLSALRSICDRHGALLIADEIWTGMGRSGNILCSTEETTPDLVCIGKGLGAGIPISACIGRDEVMHAWAAHGGSAIHTATHFGAPSACAAATAVIDALTKDEHAVGANARDLGAKFSARLASGVGDASRVRGRGMMIGLVTDNAHDALRLSRRLLARGYITLTGGKNGDVLTLTPAFNISENLLFSAADAIAEAFCNLAKNA